ncbi:MAG: hypothetical protein AUK30_10455 [Nitrospirae bacterium CG2_30_70_394]|nr:MAG: hypothetical protein AUK30_10455 [Nitrospirae bacterium CG2_30_70_394]PIW81861.1 MAG: hypothetical protein COZ96_11715 [Nitrospirae bacterium CG_4_8_14_3_um_filter_70_85]PIX83620.1 MAG: hypothetical protein COZ33_04500 [Nitrospirae bacterium CG_4_10_14_3_um_filter_70_108]HBB41039.1 hypothetical protein [Pseudomonadota bacterium]
MRHAGLLLFLLCASASASGGAAGEVTNFVVAVVGNEVISAHDCTIAWRIAGQNQAPMELIESLVDRRLLVAEGRRFGLATETVAKVDEAAVEARVRQLDAAHTSVERPVVRRWLEEEAILRAFERVRIDPFMRVDPAAKRAAYDNAPERYAGKPFYEVEEEITRELSVQARQQRLAEVIAALRSRTRIVRPAHPLALPLGGAVVE